MFHKVSQMKNTEGLLSYELKTLGQNIDQSGDPLGFKKPYWTDWCREEAFSRTKKNLLFTGRMYQMLPYIMQTTQMVPFIKPLVSKKTLRPLVDIGNRVAGEPVIRWKAGFHRQFKQRCEHVLQGVAGALKSQGKKFSYLFEEEPYSGVLLYDLGLVEQVEPHIRKVSSLFARYGVERIVTLDPHSTFMLRSVYPEIIGDLNFEVKHYAEILAEEDFSIDSAYRSDLPGKVVIHDSCIMTRELAIEQEPRTVLDKLDIRFEESSSYGRDTACCGGPVEYAFPKLSQNIARARVKELREISSDIVVNCPICYLNFVHHEQDLGVRIWDLGELLHKVFCNSGNKCL